MTSRRAVLSLLLLIQTAAFAQGVHPVSGRRYAGVMGPAESDWLVRPERELEEQPDRALDEIGIAKGSTVADVGAGAGYFTWRLSERVGPTGKVYGNDIEPRMLELLRANLAERRIVNVEPVLGTFVDAKLPLNSLDLVLLVDVYHEFSQPQKMLQSIRNALKSNGRLVLLEYRAEDPAVPIRPEHKMTVEQVKIELAPEGFRFERASEKLPRQHILIFRKSVQ